MNVIEREDNGLMTNDLVFAKVRPDAIIPTKENENAGYDLYANFDKDYMIIPAHTTKLIPTGIACAMCDKYYMQIEERGSTGSKGIKKSAGVVDSGYRNEIFVAISNVNKDDLIISKYATLDELQTKHSEDIDLFLVSDNPIIYPYSKAIAQGVIHEVPKMNVYEISYKDLQKIPSKRGMGSLGSSGK